MLRRSPIAVLAAFIVVLIAVVGAAPSVPPLAIIGTSVVDVVTGRVVPDATIVIDGDAIVRVAPHGTPPKDARIVDGRRTFAIPGLWDMHAHTQMTGEPWLQLDVANGVTGIRDMGSDLDFIVGIRDATASGRMLAPRVFAAGPILDDAPGDWPFRLRVKTPDDGRNAVRMLKARGMDLVKVHNNTPRDVFFAIAEEAHRLGIPVAGHVPLKVTVQEAIDAGISSIEHLSEDGRVWKACSGKPQYDAEACRPFFEMLARRHVWQTPTLIAMFELPVVGTPASTVSSEQMSYAGKGVRALWAGNQSLFLTRPEVLTILRRQAETAKTVVRDMVADGVDVLAGCDGLIAGFCVHQELSLMVSGGMTPIAALRTATINPARYFGREKTLGTISPGKAADLVLLDGNPLLDIGNVGRIHAVVRGGRFLDRRALDEILARVKAAAAQ